MKKTVIFVVLAMVLIGSCAAQSSNDAQRIVGTWVSQDGKATVVFKADGTGTWGGVNIFYGISATGVLYIVGTGGGTSITPYISPDGRRMILTDGRSMMTENEVLQKK